MVTTNVKYDSLEEFVEANLNEIQKAISIINKKKEIDKMKIERDKLIHRAKEIQRDIDGMIQSLKYLIL